MFYPLTKAPSWAGLETMCVPGPTFGFQEYSQRQRDKEKTPAPYQTVGKDIVGLQLLTSVLLVAQPDSLKGARGSIHRVPNHRSALLRLGAPFPLCSAGDCGPLGLVSNAEQARACRNISLGLQLNPPTRPAPPLVATPRHLASVRQAATSVRWARVV